jgi:glycosyltransferase involved in cell wall biosynthesis
VKVLFSTHAYWPSLGGAERYAQGLAEGLAGRGHEVHVVAPDVDDPEAFYELGHSSPGRGDETVGEVQVHRVPYIGMAYRLLGRFRSPARVLRSSTDRFKDRLASLIAALGPDVLVALPHLFPNVEEVIRLRETAAWKLIYVPMLHEDDPYWSIERVSEAVARADGVVALTDHEQARLLASYGVTSDRAVVVPPGVAFGENHMGERDPIVLFVGRRTESKRLDVLHEAMKAVWQDHPEIRLVLAGSPPGVGVDPAIWMAADPRVAIVDRPNEPEKHRLMGRAWVVVNPSLTESFGITTLEAWAQRTPVVVTDSPVNRSVVRDGVDGLVAAGDDAAGLAAALNQVLASSEKAKAMGAAGRERVKAEFTWEKSAGALDVFLRRI